MSEGYQATGRSFWGPTDRLVELVDDRAVYTAVHLHREYRDAPALIDALQQVESFLERPGVPGLAPLASVQPRKGLLVFETGPVWPMCQVLSMCKRDDAPSRQRATIELLARSSAMLDVAAHRSEPLGVPHHRGLTPWRIGLRPDGAPVILGWGIPQLELLDELGKLDVDSFRWCPPERLNGDDEDITSDLLSLALMGFELLTGQPLFEGDAERVRLAAERGLGPERLHRWRDRLEAPVHEALERALQVHPDARWPDADEFHAAFADLATSPLLHGPDLAGLLAWVAERDEQPPAWPPESRDEAPEDETPRWERTARRSAAREAPPSRAPEPPPPVTPSTAPSEAADRLRRRAPPDHNAMYPPEPLGPQAVRVCVRSGGVNHWTRLDPSESLARSSARLVDVLEFSPVDLCGRIRGWYRIVQGEDAWYGEAPTSVANLDEPLELEWIPNRELPVVVHAEGGHVLEAVVGTAVHAQFLVGELRRVLDLDGASWRLQVDDHVLDPWQVLDDLALSPGATLQLVKHRPRRVRRRTR